MPNNNNSNDEPKWKGSKARELLYQNLLDGKVPLDAKDNEGKCTMKLREIYGMHPKYFEFLYKNFSCQVSGLRKLVKLIKHQSAMDEKALATYIKHHPVLKFWHKEATFNSKDLWLRSF